MGAAVVTGAGQGPRARDRARARPARARGQRHRRRRRGGRAAAAVDRRPVLGLGARRPRRRGMPGGRGRRRRAGGGLEVWVNNAGMLVTGHVWEHDEALRRTLFEVNTLGTINGSLAALERMRRSRARPSDQRRLARRPRGAPGRGAVRGDQAWGDGVHARRARRPAPRRRAADQRLGRLPRRDLDADAPRQARRPRRGAVVLGHSAARRDGRRGRRRAARPAAGRAHDPSLARRHGAGVRRVPGRGEPLCCRSGCATRSAASAAGRHGSRRVRRPERQAGGRGCAAGRATPCTPAARSPQRLRDGPALDRLHAGERRGTAGAPPREERAWNGCESKVAPRSRIRGDARCGARRRTGDRTRRRPVGDGEAVGERDQEGEEDRRRRRRSRRSARRSPTSSEPGAREPAQGPKIKVSSCKQLKRRGKRSTALSARGAPRASSPGWSRSGAPARRS